MSRLGLRHCVSSLTDWKSGISVGFRISLTSFLIAASISPPSTSESPSSAASVFPYNLVAYCSMSMELGTPDQDAVRCRTPVCRTYFLEQIPQVSHGFAFFLHGACGPDAHIPGLDAPGFESFFPGHVPLLFPSLEVLFSTWVFWSCKARKNSGGQAKAPDKRKRSHK